MLGFLGIRFALLAAALTGLSAGAAFAEATASPRPPAPSPSAAPPFVLAPWTGGERPAFVLSDLNDEPRVLSAFRGRVVLVHFFATWCEPCVPEMAALQRLAQAWRGAPLAIVAVDVGEVDLRVRNFFKTRPVDFPVLLDRDRAIAKAWQVSVLPSTFILDTTLKPRLFVEGDLDWSQPDVASAIAALYPKPPHRDAPAVRRPTPPATGGNNGPT